ncbi:hypothetical protein GGS20DRAFT_458236 [Poronia punctata]|nr:hypothetical protein GGS20DRAFT_458236 [Poronia punctata]
MMDPFSALSVACAVVQFVEFGIKLTMGSSEIYQSINGQTEADRLIMQTTSRLGDFAEQLDGSLSNSYSSAEMNIAALARECAVEAEKLRRILYSLQALTSGERVKSTLDTLSTETDQVKVAALVKAFRGDPKFETVLRKVSGASDEEKLKTVIASFPVPNARKRSTILVASLKGMWQKKEVQEIRANLKEYRAQLTLCIVGLMNDKQSSITALLQQLVESSASAKNEKSSQVAQLQETLNHLRALMTQATANQFVEPNLTPIPGKLNTLIKLGDSAIETVLRRLKFDSMRTREAAVSPAYQKTFEWLFTDESPFYSWLIKSSGIFWVSGKPGSGKSTLMKFASQHGECRAALQEWAGDRILITASFYFWHPGTPMQRSLEGLLQTVLFQIMRACPLLIPVIAPDRWAGALNQTVSDPWTWEEATATLSRFLDQTKIQCATCLFIDGLDEFGGDHSEIVKILSRVSEHSNVKLCLASRPHNVFADAFGRWPDRMLRLQDLTREDIRNYVNDNLLSHSSLSETNIYDDQYATLVQDIVNKAEGVFLWVYLVVRSLKDGLTNADTISKLQQRLQKLPSGLSEYFDYILGSVDEVYWEDTAKVFEMMVLAKYPLPPGVLSVLDEDNPDYCLEVGTRLIPAEGYEHNIKIIERRLNARCKGLLEIRKTPGSMWGSDDYSDRYLVSYLHRTVRDFLRNEDVVNLLKSRLAAPFDADLALCRGFVLHIKRFIISEDPLISKKLSCTKALEDLVYFAHRIEVTSGAAPVKVLDEALVALGVIGKVVKDIGESLFYAKVIQHGLSHYLEHCLSINPRSLDHIKDERGNTSLPLELALTSAPLKSDGDRYDCFLKSSPVRTLVRHGANPNDLGSGPSRITVWRSFVSYSLVALYDRRERDECFEAFVILLKAGAERYPNLSYDIKSIFPPHQSRQLEELINDLDAGQRKDSSTTHAIVQTQTMSEGADYKSVQRHKSDDFGVQRTYGHGVNSHGKEQDNFSSPATAEHQLDATHHKGSKPRFRLACRLFSCF